MDRSRRNEDDERSRDPYRGAGWEPGPEVYGDDDVPTTVDMEMLHVRTYRGEIDAHRLPNMHQAAVMGAFQADADPRYIASLNAPPAEQWTVEDDQGFEYAGPSGMARRMGVWVDPDTGYQYDVYEEESDVINLDNAPVDTEGMQRKFRMMNGGWLPDEERTMAQPFFGPEDVVLDDPVEDHSAVFQAMRERAADTVAKDMAAHKKFDDTYLFEDKDGLIVDVQPEFLYIPELGPMPRPMPKPDASLKTFVPEKDVMNVPNALMTGTSWANESVHKKIRVREAAMQVNRMVSKLVSGGFESSSLGAVNKDQTVQALQAYVRMLVSPVLQSGVVVDEDRAVESVIRSMINDAMMPAFIPQEITVSGRDEIAHTIGKAMHYALLHIAPHSVPAVLRNLDETERELVGHAATSVGGMAVSGFEASDVGDLKDRTFVALGRAVLNTLQTVYPTDSEIGRLLHNREYANTLGTALANTLVRGMTHVTDYDVKHKVDKSASGLLGQALMRMVQEGFMSGEAMTRYREAMQQVDVGNIGFHKETPTWERMSEALVKRDTSTATMDSFYKPQKFSIEGQSKHVDVQLSDDEIETLVREQYEYDSLRSDEWGELLELTRDD